MLARSLRGSVQTLIARDQPEVQCSRFDLRCRQMLYIYFGGRKVRWAEPYLSFMRRDSRPELRRTAGGRAGEGALVMGQRLKFKCLCVSDQSAREPLSAGRAFVPASVQVRAQLIERELPAF